MSTMIFNQKNVIESFVHSFCGPSAIRSADGIHLLINTKWISIIGNVHGMSIYEMQKDTTDEVVKKNSQYCIRCDEEAIKYQEPVYKYENFKGKRYSTIRIPIVYDKQSAILILCCAM